MNYKRFDISNTNLEKGMIVNGKIKKIVPYGAFVEIENRSKWTFVHRRHEHIKNKITL